MTNSTRIEQQNNTSIVVDNQMKEFVIQKATYWGKLTISARQW